MRLPMWALETQCCQPATGRRAAGTRAPHECLHVPATRRGSTEPDPGTGVTAHVLKAVVNRTAPHCPSLYQPSYTSAAHPTGTGGTEERQSYSYCHPYSLVSGKEEGGDGGKRKVLPMHSTENRSRSIYTARKIQTRTGNSTHIPVH